MVVLMFERQFVPGVLALAKLATIRRPRRRPVSLGDVLSLRCWAGLPYRSRQVELRCVVCMGVSPVRVDGRGRRLLVEVAGVRLARDLVDGFARGDGFTGPAALLAHYRGGRGLPFDGVLIRWGPLAWASTSR